MANGKSVSAKRSASQKKAAINRLQTWKPGQSGNIKGRPSDCNGKTARDYQLWSKFRITSNDYNALLNKQNEVCAICGKPEIDRRCSGSNEDKKIVNLCIDHDHKTGRIRGLLCSRCNTGLGKLGDDISILKRAIEYLENGTNNQEAC